MHPVVFILPGFLLLLVMTLMLGAAAWPSIQLWRMEPGAWNAVLHYQRAEQTTQIASWWCAQLSGLSAQQQDIFRTALKLEIGKYVYLHGDFPSRIGTDIWSRGLLAKALHNCNLDASVLPKHAASIIKPDGVVMRSW